MPPTVILTGASRGLGEATARILARAGARLVLNARSGGALRAVVESIRESGGEAVAVPGDISRPQVAQRLVERALERFGGLEAVVNNAATLEAMGPVARADPEAWRRSWAVNVLGPVMLTQAALVHLRSSCGRVINVSSGAAVHAIAGWAAYCADKAALNQFTAVLAEEEPQITAVAFRPGVVDTAMQAFIRQRGRELMPERVYAEFVRRFEAGELLPPEVPGRALAALALHAPAEWSGSFRAWDEPQVYALVEAHLRE